MNFTNAPISHNNNFNLLRLLAAVQVVVVHAIDHLMLPIFDPLRAAIGQFPGVAMFFVVSGFLVTDSYLRSDTPSFFRKRALRIYPALLVNILVLDLCVAIGGGLSVVSWPTYFFVYLPTYALTASSWIASNLTALLPGLPGGASAYVAGFYLSYPSGVLWTLTVELSFYLCLPLFLSLTRSKPMLGSTMIVGCAIISASLALVAGPKFFKSNQLFNITLTPYFWIFSVGILARLAWHRIRTFFEGKALFWLTAYSLLTLWFVNLPGPTKLEHHPPGSVADIIQMIVLAGLIFSLAFSYVSTTNRVGIAHNDFSYGLYLYHMLVIQTFASLGWIEKGFLWPGVFALSFLLASLSWFFVEQPALRMKVKKLTTSYSHRTQS